MYVVGVAVWPWKTNISANLHPSANRSLKIEIAAGSEIGILP